MTRSGSRSANGALRGTQRSLSDEIGSSAARARRRTSGLLAATAAFVALSISVSATSEWSSEVLTLNEEIAGAFADQDLLDHARAVAAANPGAPTTANARRLESAAGDPVRPGISWSIIDVSSATVTIGVKYHEGESVGFLLPHPTPWGVACRSFRFSDEATVSAIVVPCPPGFGEPETNDRSLTW